MVSRRFLIVVLFILLVTSFLESTSLQARAQVTTTPVPRITRGNKRKNTSSKVASLLAAAAKARGLKAPAGYVLPPGVKPYYFSPTPDFGLIPRSVRDTTIRLTDGGGSGATAQALVSGVTGLKLVSGGSGYTSAPTVSFLGGGGTGAAATATISNGVVVSLTLITGGSGYGYPPTVVLTGGGVPTPPAVARASVAPGAITGIVVINPGSGYTSAPAVNIMGSGQGAIAIAKVTGGRVTGIAVTDSGFGYGLVMDNTGQSVTGNSPTGP